jgi:hypothetical protein
VVVPRRATFADLLEAELNCTNVPHAFGWQNRPLTTPLFVFAHSGPAGQSGGVGPRYTPPSDPPRGPVGPMYVPTPEERARLRSARPTSRTIRLSGLERRALAALNSLGAGLDENLSPSSLRRAFRELARRYHPDRHPGSSPAEQERLARVFVEATEHYRVLAAAMTAA